MILLSDTDVPRHALPALPRTVGDYLPLTHAAAAARELAAGTGLGEVLPLLGKEFLIGVGYAAAAAVLLKLFELESRRKATLDTI